MTNKTTKRALLSSTVALFLCFAMLMGTTYAWFTDSVTSANNVIQSGNLDVVLEYKSAWSDNWAPVDENTKIFKDGALYEPGYTEVVFLRVSNAGSLALKYNLLMNVADTKTGVNVNGEKFNLSDYLMIGTYAQDEYNGDFNYADILMPAMFGDRESALSNVASNLTTLSEANSFIRTDAPVLAGEKTAQVVALVLTMPDDVGNEANARSLAEVPEINLGITLFATQLAAENDSFGNQYDKDANYDEYWDSVADISWYDPAATEYTLNHANQLAGLAMLVNSATDNFAGKTVKLASNVNLGDIAWYPIGASSATPFKGNFDGNGMTVSNLYVNTNSSYAGLFGYVSAGVKVSNLTIENVTLEDTDDGTDTTCYGAAIGYCPGAVTLDNVNVVGDIQINTEWYVGGVIGRSKGSKITNCSVVGEDGSVIGNGRWIAGIVGYDNGALKISDCLVENVTLKADGFAGGVAGLGAASADINSNAVKNVNIVLEDAAEAAMLTYGTVIGGVSVYSYSGTPVYVYNNTIDNVNCTVNTVAVAAQEIGSKYEDGTDQGLIMTATIKVGNGYYTYLKKAIEVAPKDGTEYVIELTGDTYITAKFKPSVAKNQNIVIKTNGYKLIWVEQDANKLPVTDAEGNLVTVTVTADNFTSYITVKSGGSCTVE